MKTDIELFNEIKKVEAPPFLFTRIEAQIYNTEKKYFSSKLTWSLSALFFLILVLNISVIIKLNHRKEHNVNMAEAMNLLPHNELYYE